MADNQVPGYGGTRPPAGIGGRLGYVLKGISLRRPPGLIPCWLGFLSGTLWQRTEAEMLLMQPSVFPSKELEGSLLRLRKPVAGIKASVVKLGKETCLWLCPFS